MTGVYRRNGFKVLFDFEALTPGIQISITATATEWRSAYQRKSSASLNNRASNPTDEQAINSSKHRKVVIEDADFGGHGRQKSGWFNIHSL
jgi:hypothetical protein